MRVSYLPALEVHKKWIKISLAEIFVLLGYYAA